MKFLTKQLISKACLYFPQILQARSIGRYYFKLPRFAHEHLLAHGAEGRNQKIFHSWSQPLLLMQLALYIVTHSVSIQLFPLPTTNSKLNVVVNKKIFSDRSILFLAVLGMCSNTSQTSKTNIVLLSEWIYYGRLEANELLRVH
jgi:hypothetical protein